MHTVYPAKKKPLKAIMAITDDRMGLKIGTIIFHDALLLVRCMLYEKSFDSLGIVSWGKLGIPRWLWAKQRDTAEPCVFTAFCRFHPYNPHLVQYSPDSILFIRPVPGAPAILQGNTHPAMIRIGE